jgi:hypothetical protein
MCGATEGIVAKLDTIVWSPRAFKYTQNSIVKSSVPYPNNILEGADRELDPLK